MRVIAGKYKGKPLFSPPDERVRPTSDRIKETIFNILSSRMSFDGVFVLDLFAGSGALGIETLSRGAADAIFVDYSSDSIKLINANLAKVSETRNVYNADYKVAIKKLEGSKFDLILIDPPYAQKLEKTAIDLILKYDILKKDGVIFVEHSRDNKLDDLFENFLVDTRNCGSTAISFFSYK